MTLSPSDHPGGGEIVLVTSSDENYAVTLAASVRSALDHLGARRRLRLFVLDGGIEPATRDRLVASWDDPRLTIEWTPVTRERLRHAPIDGHASMANYSRLLMPELLPADVARAIYLDADTLVRRDLGDLWDEPHNGFATLAVQDQASPVMDAERGLGPFPCCRWHMAEHRPVANYHELGLRADDPYFNSGLLVVDLNGWRSQRVTERALACLQEHREHVWLWDQYALNVVLAGTWRPLDPRWNQIAHVWNYPTWRESPYDREAFRTLRRDPWIVHFTSGSKPWHRFCPSPFTGEFRAVMARVGWEHERRAGGLSAWWKHHYERRRRDLKRWLRALPRSGPWAAEVDGRLSWPAESPAVVADERRVA